MLVVHREMPARHHSHIYHGHISLAPSIKNIGLSNPQEVLVVNPYTVKRPKVAIVAFACNVSSSIVNRDERNIGHTVNSDTGEWGRRWSDIVSGIRREKCRGTGS